MTTPETDDDCCRVCGHAVNINPDMEWPDGHPICWGCLWEERCELAEQNKALREALLQITNACVCDCPVVQHGQHQQHCPEWIADIAEVALTSTKGPQE